MNTQNIAKALYLQIQLRLRNVIRNSFFAFSAVSFFYLQFPMHYLNYVGIAFAFVLWIIFCANTINIKEYIQSAEMYTKCVAFLSSLGICWYSMEIDYDKYGLFSPTGINTFEILCALLAFYFVYACSVYFWKRLSGLLIENGILKGITGYERLCYYVLLYITLCYVTIAFYKTEVFYTTQYPYDIVYTSDTSNFLDLNIYLHFLHYQNDIRQPLFAVFAAPFIGIPYLFGKIFSASPFFEALLMNYVQIVLLFLSNIILTRMLDLSKIRRICFIVITSCTYMQLLSVVMIEQYIVAYFWLVLVLYLICNKRRPDCYVMCGAGGTMLTSFFFLPFITPESESHAFGDWIVNILKCGVCFIAMMLAFCRFEVLYDSMGYIVFLSDFTGKNVSLINRMLQYINFGCSCFFAPSAGPNFTMSDWPSWQMAPVENINIGGVIILVLVLFSAFLNRKKKSSILAVCWIAFSAVILIGLGWGTKENGLILYSLYFGWAFSVLLFQLLEWIEDRLNSNVLIPVFSLILVFVLLATNVPAVIEMINFGITYYPV